MKWHSYKNENPATYNVKCLKKSKLEYEIYKQVHKTKAARIANVIRYDKSFISN